MAFNIIDGFGSYVLSFILTVYSSFLSEKHGRFALTFYFLFLRRRV